MLTDIVLTSPENQTSTAGSRNTYAGTPLLFVQPTSHWQRNSVGHLYKSGTCCSALPKVTDATAQSNLKYDMTRKEKKKTLKRVAGDT